MKGILKKRKVVPAEEENGGRGGGGEVEDQETPGEDQESLLVELLENRDREVKLLEKSIEHYTKEHRKAVEKRDETEKQLARFRRDSKRNKSVKVESSSTSLVPVNDTSSRNQTQSRTELVIPAVKPKVSQPLKLGGSGTRDSSALTSSSTRSDIVKKEKAEKPGRSHRDLEVVDIARKRKLEQRDHKELIPMVCRSSSPHTLYCRANNHISSQHRRKLRSLALCPVNDQLFATSALDGLVNLWQLEGHGSTASILSSTECISPKNRRWPEDIAWHPSGNSLVASYTADKDDSQIAIIELNKTHETSRVTFLQDKPHVKGLVNEIMFMPWGDPCFVTGGSDHAVVVWNEDAENAWKPKILHSDLHSSGVMGIAGMQQKPIVLSAGADKRIIGFDVQAERAEFRNQVDSKCMSVLPNPCDINLYMVQTGTPEKQLRLFDVRSRQSEIHTFGFKQESSDSQSALINQGWSSDGWYLSSGSVDPVIHIFDIRYNGRMPSQSIRAHQKRVFKAEFHYSLPLLISISSDLQIGLHKI